MPKKKATKSRAVRLSLERMAIAATEWIGSIESLVTHTALFVASFSLVLFGVSFDRILLAVTTVLSLGAIYLSIFIQMSVNRQAEKLEEVEKNIDEIQEDVEEIQEDIDEIQEDVEEIQVDVGEIQEDVEEIQEDVEELQEDVGEIHDDVHEEPESAAHPDPKEKKQ